MSSTWDRTRCICWWWTRTPARAPCPRIRTRRSCGSPNSSTTPEPSAPRGSTNSSPSIQDALQAAEDKGVEDLLPFATSAVREATNADDVLARVQAETGVELQVLTGAEEARLTFLAARRWFGWSAGQAARPRHRRRLPGDRLRHRRGARRRRLPPARRRPADRGLAPRRPARPRRTSGRCAAMYAPRSPGTVGEFSRFGAPDHVVATSKTFKQLARIAGRGPLHGRPVRPARAEARVPGGPGSRELAAMTTAERASPPRSLRGPGQPARRGRPGRRGARWTSSA